MTLASLAIASVEQTAKLDFDLSGLRDEEKEKTNQLLQTHYGAFAISISDLRVAKGVVLYMKSTLQDHLYSRASVMFHMSYTCSVIKTQIS